MYYSQANQDKWVCHILNNKINGYFLDLGAHDGISHNNTYFLEKNLNWTGICVEADKNTFNVLKNNRKTTCINAAVLNYNGICKFQNTKVQENGNDIVAMTLNTILEENNVPINIDYMSIDIEGSEYNALSVFDFSKWDIKLITLEHNLYLEGPKFKDKLFELMNKSGYTRVADNVVCLENHPSVYGKPFEDWYVKNDYINELKTNINSWK